ncbi:hypothetical protein DFH07DRAFT_1034864 [Mycena maculata]|uniref:Sacsin/Nov domain-containing protein n=1 Tax=Mycena maculata TaxID=230809 RepID=A0AAD7IUN6_9AGAR|nr:hypothetical protein DFH07DRAFT_1034864 [Mycena maculata]
MPQNFRERADLTKIIKSILDAYPLGNGILRELLQNSDDASATKQVWTINPLKWLLSDEFQTFILDMRTHPSQSVVDSDLIECQGPALLAVNDTLFSDSDWTAISTLHSSSKTTDETKIGKFGIGVRACYHITDNPHFLSGRKLVIFDPHERFSDGQAGGVMIDVPTEGHEYTDQLAAFDESLHSDSDGLFPGTVVRLPLRTPAQAFKSTIKNNVVDASVIEMLFRDFVEKELSVVMLFLKHIRYICLKVISPDGEERFIGSAEIPADLDLAEKRKFSRNAGAREETFRCTINMKSVAGNHARVRTVSQAWRICHAVRSTHETSDIMNRQLGYNVGSKLANDKLFSHVALAFPVGLKPALFNGRLFTLLPLPIHTGFPVHLHAILALTQDRQSLRNIEETGTGAESRERLLVTWNRSIFDEFLPATWSALLHILVDNTEVEDIWAAWPASEHASTSGSSYWSQILPNLLKRVINLNLPIFPAFPNTDPPSHQTHVSLSSAIIASEDDDPALLLVLSKIGLTIVRLPEHIRKSLPTSSEVLLLHPNSSRVRNALLAHIAALAAATENAKDLILQYLVLAPGKVSNAIGLPLIPLVDGSCFSLPPWRTDPEITPVLVTEQEGEVFGDCDHYLISLSKMPPLVSQVFCSPGARMAINVARLDREIVRTYMNYKFGGFNPAVDEITEESDSSQIEWLTRFWKWMAAGDDKQILLPLISRFHLLPSARGTLRKMESRIVLPIPSANRTMDAWGILGVHFLHPDVVAYSAAFSKFVVPATDVSFLIDSISPHLISNLDKPSALLIQDHLVQSLIQSPRSSSGKPVGLDERNRQKFLQLPIFPTRAALLDRKGGNKVSQRVIGPALGTLVYMRVEDSCPVPIAPDHTTFFDVTAKSAILGTIVNAGAMKKALDELGVLEMAIDHLAAQPLRVLDSLLARIAPRLSDLSKTATIKLQSIPFVPVVGSPKRIPPAQVIDPRSDLASLYRGEPGKLPSGRWGEEPYLSLVSSHGFFQRELTSESAAERITYLSSSWPEDAYPQIFAKAQIFLRLLDSSWPFVSSVAPHLTRAKWLPVRADTALASPAECRDSDKLETAYLFDLVLSAVNGKVHLSNNALRTVLGWDHVPIQVLQEQFRRALTHPAKRGCRLHALIREFSRRSGTLPDGDIESLKRTVSHRPWVPVESTNIIETKHALLRSSILGGPFKTVPRSLLEAHNGQGTIFLQKMGCVESPCLETLLTELELLIPEENTDQRVAQMFKILEEIAILPGRSAGDYERISVPGVDGVVHPIGLVYYADSGTDFLPDFRFAAHPKMSASLARDLGVQFLSSLELGDEDDDDDLQMGEDFINRVGNILKEHDVQYALNEFLANAVDAKAREFSIHLDERTFEYSKVMAPGLAELQQRPSLFLYNDAKLSKADFRGLRKVGQGGKRSDPDSIGRYGLGALSLFHFTDVVQIVSDEQLLILDPSGTHLPPLRGGPRTSLIRRISDVFRRFPDQLSVFDSIHGFSKSASAYPGTLFRLPLRDGDKDSILSSTVLRVSDCLNLLKGPYFELAKHAMYFTCLEHISAGQQSSMGQSTSLWSVVAARESQGDHGIVTLKANSHNGTTSSQRWLVTKSATPIDDVPAEYSKVLEDMGLHQSQVGLVVQTALVLKDATGEEATPRLTVPSRTSPRFLFSSLRLPVQTSLSAHISAQFAISSDRRHIRFEAADASGYRLPQAAFNQWILDNLIPPLYISSIQYAARSARIPRNPFSWWPVPNSADDSGSISRVIVQAFYDSVVETSAAICYTVTSQLIAPIDAIFSTDRTPSRVQEVLRKLETSDLVQLPYAIHRLVIKAAAADQLRFVDPSSVKEVLESRTTKLAALFHRERIDVPVIDATLLFLLEGNIPVSDLRLIVLADGNLTHGNAQQPPKYVCEGEIPDIFSSSHFLHRQYSKATHDLLIRSSNMNVKLFDATGVLYLVKERIHPQPRCIHSAATEQWITRFWQIYNYLPGPLPLSFLDSLPLIPTTGGDYISLEYCRRDEVMTEHIERPTLVSAMQRMDLVFCQVPAPLRDALNKPFNLQAYLKVIRFKASPLESLSLAEIRIVGEWVRSELYTCTDSESRNVVKGLPIWEARRDGETLLLPARHLAMLPRGLGWNTFDGYITPGTAIANFSHSLETVLSWPPMNQPVTSEWLAQLLTFPTFLHPSDIGSYATLLTVFLSLGGEGQIPVPDGDLRLRNIDQLYDQSVPLFSAALQSCERTMFLHPNFRQLQGQLRLKNLHYNVDWDAFLLCAKTVHADLAIRQLPESEIMQRAEVVFEFYNSRLPHIVMTNAAKWGQLNGLRFVPRRESRSSSSSYSTDSYCGYLPEIVAPGQILQDKYEEVAWSQRALPGQLLPGLIALNASLGVPTAAEVVKHLAVLALRVAPEHPRNRTLLQQIRSTYRWLSENKEEAREHLLRTPGALFLNVDDPENTNEPWEWRPAGELMFNVEYDYHETNTFRVRQFLQDYRHLVLAAGANKEEDVDYRPQTKAQDDNTLREAFNVMRKQRQLTDVVLMPVRTDGEDIDVATLWAHSTFLSAAIRHVRDARVGWLEGGSDKHSFPGTYFGARAVLDFIYTGKIEAGPDETDEGHMSFLQDLLELLEAADEWDMLELKDEIGRLVKDWKLLSRDTYWMSESRNPLLTSKTNLSFQSSKMPRNIRPRRFSLIVKFGEK